MRTLRKAISKYPEQVFLFLFNTGFFAWLQTTGSMIASKLGFSGIKPVAVLERLPDWLHFVAGDSLEKLQSFFGSWALTWLILSMSVLIIIRFIKGLVKFILFTAIIVIGVFLILQNQQVLQNLNLTF